MDPENYEFIQNWDIIPIGADHGEPVQAKFAYFFKLKSLAIDRVARSMRPLLVRANTSILQVQQTHSENKKRVSKFDQKPPEPEKMNDTQINDTKATIEDAKNPENSHEIYVNSMNDNSLKTTQHENHEDSKKLTFDPADNSGYLKKVQNFQAFIEKNKKYFLDFMKSLKELPTNSTSPYAVFPPDLISHSSLLPENLKYFLLFKQFVDPFCR